MVEKESIIVSIDELLKLTALSEGLPYRLMQLYSFEEDIVLDPFMGSGTTALVALKTKRNYIGYDVSEEYTLLANKRINSFKEQGNLF